MLTGYRRQTPEGSAFIGLVRPHTAPPRPWRCRATAPGSHRSAMAAKSLATNFIHGMQVKVEIGGRYGDERSQHAFLQCCSVGSQLTLYRCLAAQKCIRRLGLARPTLNPSRSRRPPPEEGTRKRSWRTSSRWRSCCGCAWSAAHRICPRLISSGVPYHAGSAPFHLPGG